MDKSKRASGAETSPSANRDANGLRAAALRPELWIIVAAAALRFWDLAAKPPHFDEGINGHFVQQMWTNGFFQYDPTNFHGPFFFYLLQIAEMTFGHGIWAFRAATAASSVLLAASAFLFRPWLGRRACLWAAAALAASPAFSFYGRYAIHETPFALGQIWFVYGLSIWRSAGGARSAAWMALGWALMATNKETFAVLLAVAAIAAAMTAALERWPRFALGFPWLSPNREPVGARRALAAAAGAAFATACFFSGFGMNLGGLRDFFMAFAFWTKTGVGASGHEKPLFYWVELMGIYEPALAIGLAAAVALLISGLARAARAPVAEKREKRSRARDRAKSALAGGAGAASRTHGPREADPIAARFMALLGLGLFSAYSLIPYKTPWCLMSAAWPFAFSFGWGVERWSAAARAPRALAVRLAAGASVAAACALAIRLCFFHAADPKEKYVYVQTTEDWTAFERKLSGAVRARPELRAMTISVLLRDPWPLPWALSRFPNASFGSGKVGPAPAADVILIDKEDKELTEARLARPYAVAPFQLRDGYEGGFAYFATETFGGEPSALGRAPAALAPLSVDRSDAAMAPGAAAAPSPKTIDK